MEFEAGTVNVRLDKIKRPGGVFCFDLRQVGQDSDGTWLRGPAGSLWGAPHDCGTLPVPVVALLTLDRPWVAWWVDDPADQRLEIDVCLPPEATDAGWRYVDLELDPVLHRAGGRVEIEDWDEYEEARRNGWMNEDDANLARSTAERCAEVLRREGGTLALARLADAARPEMRRVVLRAHRQIRTPGARRISNIHHDPTDLDLQQVCGQPLGAARAGALASLYLVGLVRRQGTLGGLQRQRPG